MAKVSRPLQCLDETGEVWVLHPGDPGYQMVAGLPKDLYRAGAILPKRLIQGRSSTLLTGIFLVEYERKIAKLAAYTGEDPDITAATLRLVQLVACLKALREDQQHA